MKGKGLTHKRMSMTLPAEGLARTVPDASRTVPPGVAAAASASTPAAWAAAEVAASAAVAAPRLHGSRTKAHFSSTDVKRKQHLGRM